VYGIELISGHNDCWYNYQGRCVYHKYTKDKAAKFKRNWDSKENCTVTQLGVQLCSNYRRELL